MIYIGTKHSNIQDHHYLYNNNFIYAIVYDYYNNSDKPDILYYIINNFMIYQIVYWKVLELN